MGLRSVLPGKSPCFPLVVVVVEEEDEVVVVAVVVVVVVVTLSPVLVVLLLVVLAAPPFPSLLARPFDRPCARRWRELRWCVARSSDLSWRSLFCTSLLSFVPSFASFRHAFIHFHILFIHSCMHACM
jgi:hypothetical protein